ncbi:MAG: NAD-dependent epimerase/dehydratase family protein [bacterium]
MGATGLIGANACEALIVAGHAVRGMKRAASHTQTVADLPVDWVTGDIRDTASLERAMEGCEAVVLAAEAYTGHYRDVGWARKIGRANAGNVKAACVEAGIRRAVFISSYATIAHPLKGQAADEARPVPPNHHPHNPYDQMKLEMEREWLEPAGGLEVVVTNPMGVWGPRDSGKSTGPVIRALIRREIPVMIDTRVNIVDARECARAQVLALEKGRAGHRYLIGGADTRMRAVAQKVARLAGSSPPVMFPAMFIPPTVALLESAGPSLNQSMKGLPLAVFAFALAYSHPFDFSKAKDELGYEPRYTLDNTLEGAEASVRAQKARTGGGGRRSD